VTFVENWRRVKGRTLKVEGCGTRLLRELSEEFSSSPLFAAEYAKSMGAAGSGDFASVTFVENWRRVKDRILKVEGCGTRLHP
jgi:hypothetical protein